MKLKRIMAMVLCFAMVLSTMSFSVFAEETTTVDSAEAFQAALETGKQISLAADITVDAAITVPDDVIIDLNDKTLYVNVENSYYNNVTIKNGNIVLGKDDVHVCDGYFLVNEGKTLELNDVNMSSAEGGIKGYAVFHLKTGANLDLINSTLNISDNEYEAGYIVYAGESTATVDVTGTTVYGTNVNGIVHAATVIKDSEFTIADAVEHGINRSAVTIEDSKVTISGGTGRGITAQHGDLVINGNSVVNISDMGEATIELRDDKNLTVADTATVTVDVAVNNTASGTITGNVTVLDPVRLPVKVSTKAELTAALGNAVDGDTILLTADIDYGTDHLTIENAITLDLGGKTLTTKARNYGLALKNDDCIVTNGKLNHAGTVAAIKVWNAKEISNLEIDVTGTSASGNTIDGIVIQENSAGVDVIKNVNIHSTAGQGVAVGIKTYNCGNATENVIGSMENVSIDAKDTGMSISAPCGTATSCNIKGGTTGIEIWIKGTYSASLDLENCTVEGGQQAVYAHDEYNDNPNTVNSGYITLTADDNTTFASDGVKLNKVINRITGAQITLPEAIAPVYVAKVGNDSYESLFETIDAAIDAAADGDTITIITDITTNEQVTIDNKNIVIDINGKTFNGSILVPTGNITIKNGSIVNTDSAVSAIEINNGVLTLTDVNIDSARHAVRIDGAVTATINGGTYRGAIGTGTGTYHAVNVSGDADVTINGGTFTGPKGTTADSGSAVNAQAGATITINGGTFAGGKNDTLAAKGTLTVYGGTFDQNPSKYIADNYVLVENGDTYSVTKNVIETTTDSGVYSDGTGVIAINVWYKEFDNNVATYGMYITGDYTKEVKSSEVTTEDGKYYVLVDEIAAAAFDKALTVKPYVVLNNNTVVYGTEITTSVNADKYLGDR